MTYFDKFPYDANVVRIVGPVKTRKWRHCREAMAFLFINFLLKFYFAAPGNSPAKNGLLRPHLLFRPFRRTNKNAFRCTSPQQKAFFYVLYDPQEDPILRHPPTRLSGTRFSLALQIVVNRRGSFFPGSHS